MRRAHERKGGPYRARDGMILGVCAGLADYFDMSVFWIRIIAVIIMVATGLWPIVGIYFLAALLMKPAPVVPIKTDADQEFYNSFTTSRSMALSRLERTYERLDRRIRRMEGIVTEREYQWRQRLGE
jgi:phage shock protein C